MNISVSLGCCAVGEMWTGIVACGSSCQGEDYFNIVYPHHIAHLQPATQTQFVTFSL